MTRRREWLRRLGLLGAVGVAGCVGDTDTTPSEEPTPSAEQTPEPTATPEPTTAATDEATETATPPGTEIHADYETTAVDVQTPDGELLGSVTAAIADTPDLRYLGLSDTPSMPDDRGMLFVYESVADRTFVMREMSFGLDILYADADGTITTIHHAPEPGPDEDGNDQRYPGRGQYVLEVNIDWTVERGVSEGDQLAFSL